MAEYVRVEVSDGVATITIDRPHKKNAMTYAMLGDFIAAVAEADADDSSHVVLVTGVPGAFCAGTDLADLATVPGEQRGLRGGAAERERWWPLVACGKPTICAVDGPAVGMGAEFTVQCDIRLCSPRARFAWNFAHRGLVADTGAGTWLLPRIVGVQRALRLLYTGEFLGAELCQRGGGLGHPGRTRHRVGSHDRHDVIAVVDTADEAPGVRRPHESTRRAHGAPHGKPHDLFPQRRPSRGRGLVPRTPPRSFHRALASATGR
jgi:Enoyl-CoA hydratase/isomerase